MFTFQNVIYYQCFKFRYAQNTYKETLGLMGFAGRFFTTSLSVRGRSSSSSSSTHDQQTNNRLGVAT